VRDLTRPLAKLRADFETVRADLEARLAATSDDGLAKAIEDSTATPAQVARLARQLRPLMMGQIYRHAIPEWHRRTSGEPSQYAAWSSLESAIEVCSYPPDAEPPEHLVAILAKKPWHCPHLWERHSHPASRRSGFLLWVEDVLVAEAIGEPRCLEMRRVLHSALQQEAPAPPEIELVADEWDLAVMGSTLTHPSDSRFRLIETELPQWLLDMLEPYTQAGDAAGSSPPSPEPT
jgi:hypothetical protein